MIVVVEVLQAAPGKTEELKQALCAIVPLSRNEEGCLEYELFEPAQGSGEFLVLMRWESSKALAQHEASKHIGEFIQKYDQVLYSEVTQYTEWKPVV
jgi:quinol monooxygenase YgiN